MSRVRRILSFLEAVSFFAVLLSGSPALADEKPKATAKPAAAPNQEEMMKAWAAFATPGAPHKTLEGMAGSWDAKATMWMAPGAPPQETSGTSENKMILGGRYLEQRYEGTMMGQPFSGIGVTGFDNYKKKFVSTWQDSMGTGILTMTGSADKAGKVLTSWGMADDPAEKRSMKSKSVVTMVDADHMTYEAWHALPDGKMTRDLEIHYTRKK